MVAQWKQNELGLRTRGVDWQLLDFLARSLEFWWRQCILEVFTKKIFLFTVISVHMESQRLVSCPCTPKHQPNAIPTASLLIIPGLELEFHLLAWRTASRFPSPLPLKLLFHDPLSLAYLFGWSCHNLFGGPCKRILEDVFGLRFSSNLQ